MTLRLCKHVWKVTLERWHALCLDSLCVYMEASSAEECLERLRTYQIQDEKFLEYKAVSLCKVTDAILTLTTDTPTSELSICPGDIVSVEIRVEDIQPHSDGLWICGTPVSGSNKIFCQMSAVKLIRRAD